MSTRKSCCTARLGRMQIGLFVMVLTTEHHQGVACMATEFTSEGLHARHINIRATCTRVGHAIALVKGPSSLPVWHLVIHTERTESCGEKADHQTEWSLRFGACKSGACSGTFTSLPDPPRICDCGSQSGVSSFRCSV